VYLDWNCLLNDGGRRRRHRRGSAEVARRRLTHVDHQVTDVMVDVTQRVKDFRRQTTQTLSTHHIGPLHTHTDIKHCTENDAYSPG